VKHRTRMTNSGMQPWVNDFKHRVLGWHYDFYMKDQARRAIGHAQNTAESAQKYFDSQAGEMQTRKGLTREDKIELEKTEGKFHPKITRHFHWKTFIPNITPYRANSNPFCPVTPNKTGWTELRRSTSDPQPMQGHAIAGTDDSVPIFPRFRG
jgi:hypothetical protein